MLSLCLGLTSQCALRSGFSPKSIPDLALWFDADDAASISIATGVSQWADKSGNNNHAVKAVGAQQPTVAVAALNGRNTIAYASAAQQHLDLTTPITAVTAADNWTVFFVYKRALVNAQVAPLGSADSASNPAYPALLFANNQIFSTSTVKRAATTGTYPDFAAYHRLGVVHSSGDAWAMLYDGADAPLTSSALVSASSWEKVGAALGATDFYTNGNIAEIIYYNRVLTAGELANVNAYLLAKWGV